MYGERMACESCVDVEDPSAALAALEDLGAEGV